MKRIACWTMIGAKNNIKDRPNSYEVFGIDYMIDTNFNTWLIEINKNPALEYSTVIPKILSNQHKFVAHHREDVEAATAGHRGFGGELLPEGVQPLLGEEVTRSKGNRVAQNDLPQ